MNRNFTPHTLALAISALVAGNSAQAADIDFGAVFSLRGQSVCAPGAAIDVDTNQRLGIYRQVARDVAF